MKNPSFLYYLMFTLFIAAIPAGLAQESQNQSRLIQGIVSTANQPLAEVNITLEGTKVGTKTDDQGAYELKAKPGDVIVFSYVGLKKVSIVVEDITKTLNVNLEPAPSDLEEAVVTARKPQRPIGTIKEEKVMDVELNFNGRKFNPLKSGWSSSYIPKELVDNGLPLALTLNGKAPGLRLRGSTMFIRDREAGFLVDGVPTPIELLPTGEDIVDIFVIRQPIAPFRQPMIYIRTPNDVDWRKAQQKRNLPDHTNKNYYEEDAVAAAATVSGTPEKKRPVSKPIGPLRKISGKITHLDAPLPDVNIVVEGSDRGTKTNRRGKYELEARQGEVLIYSHVGFKPVILVVEDVTKVLNFEMIPEANELNEVLIVAKTTEGKTLEYTKKTEAAFSSSVGNFDPKKAGYSVGYVDGETINAASLDLFDVLAGKVPGLEVNPVTKEIRVRGGTQSVNTEVPPLWEVDGMVLTDIPFLDVNDIKEIRVLKSLASLTRYGSQGAGGVIVISTKSGDFASRAQQRPQVDPNLANSNFYSNDAQVATANIEAQAAASELRDQLEVEDHPERLKALAYQFEAMGLKREATQAYQKVYLLRPKYAQSYRDLANMYVQNEQFKRAWRMYMGYFNQGFKGNEEGIGELVYDEMEWLYFRRSNQTDISQNFQPMSEDLDDFKNDVRFVFEWNTSEAEFDLEFVSPDKRAYVFEHTLAANQQLILDEKRKGYSSKRFFIDDVNEGEWLINLTYKGNKKDEPTFFKVTVHYNWGKHNESTEVKVYQLNDNQRQKLQLLKVNKQILLAYN